MWIMRWHTYKMSKLATVISVVGAFSRYGGAMFLFGLFDSVNATSDIAGLLAASAVFFAVGIGFHFLAERIAFNKSKDYLREKGFENAIRQGSLQAAVEVYNVMPNKRTVDYFETLNHQVAESIRGLIAAKKASKN